MSQNTVNSKDTSSTSTSATASSKQEELSLLIRELSDLRNHLLRMSSQLQAKSHEHRSTSLALHEITRINSKPNKETSNSVNSNDQKPSHENTTAHQHSNTDNLDSITTSSAKDTDSIILKERECYVSCGKMFWARPYEQVMQDMKLNLGNIEDDVQKLNKVLEQFEQRYKQKESILSEMLKTASA